MDCTTRCRIKYSIKRHAHIYSQLTLTLNRTLTITPPLKICGQFTQRTANQSQYIILSTIRYTLTFTHLHTGLRALLLLSRRGELRMRKLKSHLLRTQSLNILSLKPGVGQYIAIHATLTARDFFLAYFYPSGPFICIFSKTSPYFSCVGCG